MSDYLLKIVWMIKEWMLGENIGKHLEWRGIQVKRFKMMTAWLSG